MAGLTSEFHSSISYPTTFLSVCFEFSPPPTISLALVSTIFFIPVRCGCASMRLLTARISIHSALCTASFGAKVLAVQTSCFRAMFEGAAKSRSRSVVSCRIPRLLCLQSDQQKIVDQRPPTYPSFSEYASFMRLIFFLTTSSYVSCGSISCSMANRSSFGTHMKVTMLSAMASMYRDGWV